MVIVIKVYRECEEYPKGGKYGLHFEKSIQVGDSLMVEGPVGKTRYLGAGQFQYFRNLVKDKKTKICLIAGGSGIAPLYSIALASCLAKEGYEVRFLFSNKTKGDILCEKELNELVEMCPDTFKLFHTLTRHDDSKHGEWKGLTGRVSWKMLQQCGFPAAADNVFIASCGPAGFKDGIAGFLRPNGYVSEKHFF